MLGHQEIFVGLVRLHDCTCSSTPMSSHFLDLALRMNSLDMDTGFDRERFTLCSAAWSGGGG